MLLYDDPWSVQERKRREGIKEENETSSDMRFEVLKVVKMLMLVFCIVMPCGLVGR
jgi:hypothetical protein